MSSTELQKKAVVLACDYGYIRQLETTLKSICYHASQFKFYIFNQDIPKEWFNYTREKLRKIGSELIDVKLLDERLKRDWTVHTSTHINFMAYARYFISEIVTEDVVLYLDCDLVVTTDITSLFTIDLDTKYVAAVYDSHGRRKIFNSGVLLINNKLWKKDNICEKLLEFTETNYDTIKEGDQTVLNEVFSDNWLRLDGKYNFPIGYDYGAYTLGEHEIFKIPIDPLPAVVHYIRPDKPWKTYSSSRLRELWWYYNGIEWDEIRTKWQEEQLEIPKPAKGLTLVTLTDSCAFEHLEYLAQKLPTCQFKLAAFTNMAPDLLRMASYPNITLYPNIIGPNLEILLEQCDFYLDINHGGKFLDHLSEIKNHKPILAFDTTISPEIGEIIFPSKEPDMLVNYLKALINS